MRRVVAHAAGVLLAVGLTGQAPGAWAADPLVEPCTGSYDWLQLNSSEWLKGDLRRMRNHTLEFKSKKLKTQTIKWKDVVTLCLAGVARFVRGDNELVQGIGRVRDDQVIVLTAAGEVEFPRGELLAILPGGATELERWYLKASLGGDFNTGNTDQTSLNGSLVLRREDTVTRGELGFYTSFGSTDGIDNVNRQRTEFKLDYFLTKRLYATLLESTLQHDQFQNVDLRATPNAGIGYRIFDRSRFEADVATGLGYQYLQYISVTPGQPESLNDAFARATLYFKWTIVNDLKLTVNHDTLIVMTDLGQSTNYTRAVLSYELTDLFNLDLTAVHNRLWQPVANDQGDLPQKDDLQLIFSLAIEIW